MRTARIASIIALEALREQWKNRFFQLVVIFSGVLLYAALLLGAMAVEQERRVLLDFGQGLIELAGLASVVLGCAYAVLRDMETKTIYLILSRPVPRRAYIAGKYAGILLGAACAMACMAALHILLLKFRGAAPGAGYAAIIFSSWLKAAVAGALTVLVSLISTSALSALSMAGIFWTLGHFTQELRFISSRLSPAAALLSKLLIWIIPDMGLLNLRDAYAAASAAAPAWGMIIGYSAVYSLVCLALASFIFSRKEF
ncbi:MAG: ABC transporter permease subunit [Elusimicrobiales bacterium]|nr:ABC transporter permease subunit [Elusimicrobiales bacterium]